MDALGELGVHLSTDAVMHTPAKVTERVMAKLVACDVPIVSSRSAAGRRLASARRWRCGPTCRRSCFQPPMQARRRPRSSARRVTDKSRLSAR
jgi:hypothetical protein